MTVYMWPVPTQGIKTNTSTKLPLFTIARSNTVEVPPVILSLSVLMSSGTTSAQSRTAQDFECAVNDGVKWNCFRNAGSRIWCGCWKNSVGTDSSTFLRSFSFFLFFEVIGLLKVAMSDHNSATKTNHLQAASTKSIVQQFQS